MTLYKKYTALVFLVLGLFTTAQANTLSPQSTPENGKEYITLATPVISSPKVVEFFSFYCGPCYQFAEKYPVAEAINKILPEGETVTKYHVGAMGPLGNELTEAWAIAMTMGKTDAVEKKLFEVVQSKKLKSVDDIKAVFAQAGIDADTYDNARGSMLVKAAIAKQNEALKAFKVTGTPTFYVDGKFQINNGGIAVSSLEDYPAAFAQVVKFLLEK
ncbi:DsbA family protein [Citrobacter sp. JGM124]|uniref:DsbA family protein n=1 Tax=Citrobacter sp. JGM124 TaxID=2799789 RepID=UPI001BAC1DF5|nr:DsbA family protein [Citrobacter sp. JGM124]MBS0848677.1 DsbA family protein [Citrobacter sp. JGM124]